MGIHDELVTEITKTSGLKDLFPILQNENLFQKFNRRVGAVFVYSSEKIQLDFVDSLTQVKEADTSSSENLIWGRLVKMSSMFALSIKVQQSASFMTLFDIFNTLIP